MAHGGENARAHALMVRPSSPFVTMGSDTSYVGKPKSLLTLFSTLERIGRQSSSVRTYFPKSSSAMNHYSGHHMKRSRSPDDNGSDSCEDDALSEEMCAVTGSTIMSSSTSARTFPPILVLR